MAWDDLTSDLSALQKRISKSSPVNVGSSGLRGDAKALVQLYFRRVRGELESLGIGDLATLDWPFHELLILANRVNRRSTYIRVLKAIQESLEQIEMQRELAIGASASGQTNPAHVSGHEALIIGTLQTMVPSAALSYRQAISDLSATGRLSYRGTAAELREALREVLDHLAPDDDVSAVQGFKLEPDRTRPTMRQKARFILRSRGQAKTAVASTEKAVDLVDELAAALVRSVYDRASVSTHGPATIAEVRRIKAYVDTVLIDLLEA